MTLTTHIVAGAAGARVFASNPVQGFIIGWLSHYVLDSIVHWDYPLASAKPEAFAPGSNEKLALLNKAAVSDFFKVSFDALLGFLLVFMFLDFRMDPRYSVLIAGAMGAVIPDFLQFVFLVWKNRFLKFLQKIHVFIHAQEDLNNRPILGIGSQALIIFLILVLFNYMQ
jgi:hypothetical protein